MLGKMPFLPPTARHVMNHRSTVACLLPLAIRVYGNPVTKREAECRHVRPSRLAIILLVAFGCTSGETPPLQPEGVLRAAFVALDGVYNSELMAPYDVLHHSVFRDSANFVEPFVVSPDGAPLITFEGLTIIPHYSFVTAPQADILIVPSTDGSMDRDLNNEQFLDWLRTAADNAMWVITVCDGAFPLAATGLANGREVTTFPADRGQLAAMFPEVSVRYEERLVVDGKFITSVGGALSYEPALYLVEELYGKSHARETATGLVLNWNLDRIPFRKVE